MIDKALKTLGKKRCRRCSKLNSTSRVYCKRCNKRMEETSTSTPEDGL